MSTTVVTGAAGWLGRALVHVFTAPGSPHRRTGRLRVLLATEDERAAWADAAGGAAGDVEVVVGDIAERATVDALLRDTGGASVVHAAAVIHPRRVEDFDRVNVRGTANMVEAAVAAGVRRLVHVSSNSPFGANPTPNDVFRDADAYAPALGYGRSKAAAEQVVLDAVARHGLDAVVVRPPWFYGPWQPERQTTFFRLVRRGRFPLLGSGRNRRSMVFVENLVDGIVAAEGAEGVAGRAFWIADERPYEMNEIVAAVRTALTLSGVPPIRPQRRVPAVVGRAARRADALLQDRGRYNAPLHVLGELDTTIACDISTARVVLGYSPRVGLLDGMVRSVEWCLARGVAL